MKTRGEIHSYLLNFDIRSCHSSYGRLKSRSKGSGYWANGYCVFWKGVCKTCLIVWKTYLNHGNGLPITSGWCKILDFCSKFRFLMDCFLVSNFFYKFQTLKNLNHRTSYIYPFYFIQLSIFWLTFFEIFDFFETRKFFHQKIGILKKVQNFASSRSAG